MKNKSGNPIPSGAAYNEFKQEKLSKPHQIIQN